MSVVKKNIIKTVSQRTGIDPNDVALIFSEVVQAICEAVKSGQRVEIRNFINIKLKTRAAKPVRDIGRGKNYILPAHTVVQIKPSKKILA